VLRDVVRAVTRASAALDRGAVRVMERRMAPNARRAAVPTDAHRRLVELAARYGDDTLGAPSRFFPAPPPPVVDERPDGEAWGARVSLLRWSSGYRPFLPEHRDDHHRWVANHTAHARLYRVGPGRPTMVVLHGWGGGAWWLEERAFVVGYWLARGFDVALFQLPFHGARAPDGVGRGPRSGALFPSTNVVRTNEAFGQAIWDLRGLATHLRARGASAIGAMGMSLGGYTTALWASLDRELAFAVAMIPAVDLSALLWRHGDASPTRRQAAAAGVSAELLAEVFAVHAPTTRPCLVPPAARMIVAGAGDRITPPDQAERLRAHWDGCALHWFPGGHLAQVGRGDAFRAVRRHLAAAGFGEPRRPATRARAQRSQRSQRSQRPQRPQRSQMKRSDR
jgi:pimeloyl-ACP methyl ester carboxylesterase